MEFGGEGAAPCGVLGKLELALKSNVLRGFWSLLQKVGGCRRLKN